MILRRVDRLDGGMRIKDADGEFWDVDKVWRDGDRIAVKLYKGEEERGQRLFPDDMVEIYQ